MAQLTAKKGTCNW